MNPPNDRRNDRVTAAVLIVWILALVALAATSAGETVRWVAAGTDAQPTGQSVPLTPGLTQAVRDAIASTQPSTVPSPGLPGTQPTTAPATQPATQPTDTGPVPGEPPLAAGARRIRVPAGSDAAKVLAGVRTGDHVLLRRDGVWRGIQVKAWSGTQAAPAYLGAYGTGKRPRLVCPGDGIGFGGGVRWFTFEDLELTSQWGIEGEDLDVLRHQDAGGVAFRGAATDVVGRRVICRGFAYDLVYAHLPKGQRSARHLFEDFQLLDAWSAKSPYHGQGGYLASVDDVTLVRPVLIGNGMADAQAMPGPNGTVVTRKPGGPTSGFDHGLYGQGGFYLGDNAGSRRVKVIAPLVADNADYGIQLRGEGSSVADGFFIGQPVGFCLNGPGAAAATGNVVIPSGMAKGYGSQVWGIGGMDWHCGSGAISNNLFWLTQIWPPADQRKPAIDVSARKRAAGEPWYGTGAGEKVTAAGTGNVIVGWPAGYQAWAPAGVQVRILQGAPLDVSWVNGFISGARAGDPACTAAAATDRVRQQLQASQQRAGGN